MNLKSLFFHLKRTAQNGYLEARSMFSEGMRAFHYTRTLEIVPAYCLWNENYLNVICAI